jgi:radical SAM superfamily enzyme YgiQ (UPF0313 family)
MRIDRNLIKTLEEFRPDFVGTTAYTCDVKMAQEILKEVKKFDKGIRTAVGGHHVTFLPGDFAQEYVDVIFLGLADTSFPEFIETMNAGGDIHAVENIVLVKSNSFWPTERKAVSFDFDSRPFPARDLTLAYRRRYHDAMGKRTTDILTSRGCPYRCVFCSCWKFSNGLYLARGPQSIVEEISRLPEETDHISFSDDNALHDISRAWKLARLFRSHAFPRN